MSISANFKAVPLVGTMDEGDLGGDGVSGTSVHQVYCLGAGTAVITAKGGGTFSWVATTNQSIDVVVKEITISSGSFIGFKARNFEYQHGPFA